ncbi:tannase/feruloyl esterase family alpha/beta hydrolase [Spirosoma taeanense]|uniref:Tannase/feruloyl esterase family alpha/beta hydrolase n=1 Tax=Spirosoma taeanense TaxID=2735870 RepID=A0A6M5Y3X9_9BACT|nr:tannase/feruloyl esterase family alpha/beta hydrolase [Spirosoma taeanense]QJW88090.1 tannase/feruloyl esterase family alpha/beta hydrolase [Spirosoma taeanense]
MKTMRLVSTVSFMAVLTLLTSTVFAQNRNQLARYLWHWYGDVAPLKPIYTEVTPVCGCETLTNISLANGKVMAASVNQEEGTCNVTAIVNHPPANDSVKVWIALPLKNWNGRFQGNGGGGFLGGADWTFGNAISQGFAVGATNTGHEGGSATFALDSNRSLNWQLIQDNAYLGIHDMTVVGKELVKAFYGKPAKYAYFVGGSMGGRQGLSEAQRYPEDYDGILSLYPAVNFTRSVTSGLWPQVVMHQVNNYIPAQKITAISKAVIEAADSQDGVVDSVIQDPIHLKFDPKVLVGKNMGGSIFTEADAEVLRRIWQGPRTVDGKFLWYGFLPGADLSATAGTTGQPLVGKPAETFDYWARYFLLANPNWQSSKITQAQFQLLFNQAVEQYKEVYATDNPDLTGFRDKGGKLMILQGLTDQLLPPQAAIDYYGKVQARMGGAKKTAAFTRLFLLPGLDHALNGAAPKPINHFVSLVRWVEEGKAPEQLKGELRDGSNKAIRSCIFYPYLSEATKFVERTGGAQASQ